MKLEWESTRAREQRLGEWHEWFAWHPVRVGEHDVRWRETVERRGSWVWRGRDFGNCWEWEYRAMEENAG